MPDGSIEPHLCRNEISHCPPETSNTEMIELCELGSPRLTDPSENNGWVFRNNFCLECWRDSLTDMTVTNDTNQFLDYNTTIVTLEPVIQNATTSSFTYLIYNEKPKDDFKSVAILNDNVPYTFHQRPIDPSEDVSVSWDLGSIRCDSDFPEVCAHFIKFPEDEDVCSGPGCGADKVQDAFGLCLDPSEYQYSDDWRKDEDFIWPEWLLMKYDNLCSSLGEKSCQ